MHHPLQFVCKIEADTEPQEGYKCPTKLLSKMIKVKESRIEEKSLQTESVCVIHGKYETGVNRIEQRFLA